MHQVFAENVLDKRIFDVMLDRAHERPCAVLGIEAVFKQEFFYGISYIKSETLLGYTALAALQHQVKYLFHLFACKWMKDYSLVDPVKEFGVEDLAKFAVNRFFHVVVVAGRVLLDKEAKRFAF